VHGVTVCAKFIGSFRCLSGKDILEVKLEEPSPIREIIKTIVEKIPRLAQALIDAGCESPKTNMLVLMNGKEISVLDRFETMIEDGDEIIFVPVVHGG
jgi:molybdopterin converting factor small subunit